MEIIFRLKLKEILDRRGMTQKELAEKTGLREAAISEIVNDTRSTYNKKHLSKIMKVLKVYDINDILEVQVYELEESK